MRIGIVIGRIGGVDGVALETEKWIAVLHRMGHQVFLVSGEYERDVINTEHQTFMPILSFFSHENVWEQRKAFFHPDPDPGPLVEAVEHHADFITKKLLEWLSTNQIELIISQNATAFPVHLSMGLGIKRAIEASGLPAIGHDHDFAWERPNRFDTPHEQVKCWIKEAFPPSYPSMKHAVINSHVRQRLLDECGIEAVLVPNVMDFDTPYGVADQYNSSLMKDLGFDPDHVLLLQATRIVRRKGIETAFELLQRLDDPRLRLLVTGSHRDDEGGHYFNELLDDLERRGISDLVVFGDQRIRNHRETLPSGDKLYTLSDAYACSTACTYFSTIEGFGNAFVEAVLARRPVFVNNYKPVFWPEIGSKGFKVVMIDNNQLTESAIEEAREVLFNVKLRQEWAEHNFDLGRKYFSYQVLGEKLSELLEGVR